MQGAFCYQRLRSVRILTIATTTPPFMSPRLWAATRGILLPLSRPLRVADALPFERDLASPLSQAASAGVVHINVSARPKL